MLETIIIKRILLILTVLAIQLLSFGQHDLGLKINFGLSYLDTRLHSNELNDT